MKRPQVRPYLWMLGGSISFAVMGTLTHVAAKTCDWPVLATVRAALPLILVLVLARLGRVKLALLRPPTLWMRSIAGSLSLISTFYALKHLPVTDVMTLTNMFPIWVALLSWPLLGEAPGVAVWVAVGSGIAGVVLIQQPHLASGNFASLVALAASLFTAVAMLGLHRLRNLDARAIVVHFSMVALVFALSCLFLFSVPVPVEKLIEGWTLPLLLGIGGTATIGQLCLTKAFATGEPAKVSVVGLTQIVFAMVLDVLFLNHELSWTTLLGIGLVIAPTAWLLLSRGAKPTPELSVPPPPTP